MHDKLRGAIYGFAIGDAIGVPVEFMERGTFNVTDMIGFGSHNQPLGTWSDDTSMVLATCDSYRELGRIDINDLLNKFRLWITEGEYAIDGKVFDFGNTTYSALRQGKGLDGFDDNGNGALMRMIPLAFMDATKHEIHDVAAITHANSLNLDICYEYVSIAKELLNGADLEGLSGTVEAVQNLQESEIKSSGFVVDTIRAALWSVITSNSYEETVLKAANLGDDTDTVAACAGGLAGIIYGFEGIPQKWINQLRGKDIVESCLF